MLETYGLFRTRFDYVYALTINNTKESQFLIYTDIFFTTRYIGTILQLYVY